MDQPAIYSETVREGIVCVWRLAFGVRRLAFARRQRNGSKPARQIRMGKNTLGASRWNVPGSRLQATDRSANL